VSRERAENVVPAGKCQEERCDAQGAYKRKGMLHQSPGLENIRIKNKDLAISEVSGYELLREGEASDPLCIGLKPMPKPPRSRRVRIVGQRLQGYLEIQLDFEGAD
jgi:hypothetical protein